MPKSIEKSSVKGGWVARDARTGRFVAVGSGQEVTKARPISVDVAEKASTKRSAALKRLADR